MKITSTIDSLGLRTINQVIRFPVKALIVCLLLVAATFPGLSMNSISTEYRAFFGPNNPQLIAFDNVEETYSKLDNVLFVIRTQEKRAFGDNSYPIIQYMTERAWQLPAASRVDSISNYQHTSVADDDLLVEDLLDPDQQYSATELAHKESIALQEPLLAGSLISNDGSTTAINVVARFDENPENSLVALVAAARELIEDTETKFPGTKVAMTGSAAMSSTFSEAGGHDAQTLIPGMYLILLFALLAVYRSVSAVLATFAVITASTIIPLGLFGYSGAQLTSISITAPIIIMTLAVADSVHILVSMLHLMRKGMPKNDALRESMRLNFLAVAVTSVTTLVGFLCLNFSDTPPYHHLGNLSAIGILAAWLFSVVLLPAIIVLLPLKVKPVSQAATGGSANAMHTLANFTTSQYKVILPLSLLISLALISQLPKLELNDHFIKFFAPSIPFRADTDFIQKHLGGAYTVHYDINSGQAQGISNPQYLQTLSEFTSWLRQQEFVTSVYSYSDIAKRLNRNMHGDDPAYYRVPEDKKLAAQYLLLYELSLPYGLDMTDRINLDKSATRVTATLDNPTARQTREFSARSAQWLKDNAAEAMWVEPTGTALLFSHISSRNIESMVSGNTVAVIAIAIILIIALEHLGLGILSMLPNVLPVALALSLWSLLVGMAGMATTIVAASSLGIVVDNTTHFLSKYLRARRERGDSKQQAIRYSFETVGVAIIANALVLICGFALLAFSPFQPNFQMGVLTAMTIAIALLVDLICLPALLMLGGSAKHT